MGRHAITIPNALAVENTNNMKFLAFCLLQVLEDENKQNLQTARYFLQLKIYKSTSAILHLFVDRVRLRQA